MKNILIIAAIIGVLFVAGIFFVARFIYPENVAETSGNSENAEMKTRIYDAELQEVFHAVEQIIPTLSTYGGNWKLTDSKTENDAATVKAEIPVIVFTDDLEVKLKETDGKTTVDVRSNSRVGKSDFGENRRHVLQILNALDEKFADKK